MFRKELSRRGGGKGGKVNVIVLKVYIEEPWLGHKKRRFNILLEITMMTSGEMENNILNILHD